MKELHKNQQKLLKLLKDNKETPLTMEELMKEMELSSTSVVFHHIQQLEKKGYLRRNPNNPKDYQISEEPEGEFEYLPVYGLAQCGPSGLTADINEIERIPIAGTILGFSAKNGFIVKAKGDSMEPTIDDGDLVVAMKNFGTFKSGKLYVCTYENSPMIKKISFVSNHYLLESLNKTYETILGKRNDIKIEGMVKNIIKYVS